MSDLSIIILDIKPGRVPDARALIRGCGPLPGLVAWKFVEAGVVNTLMGFASCPPRDAAIWARGMLGDSMPDALSGLRHIPCTGDLPAGLAASPAVVLQRGQAADRLQPLAGDLGQGLDLVCLPDLDAALHHAVLLRETCADELLLLIPEALQ